MTGYARAEQLERVFGRGGGEKELVGCTQRDSSDISRSAYEDTKYLEKDRQKAQQKHGTVPRLKHPSF